VRTPGLDLGCFGGRCKRSSERAIFYAGDSKFAVSQDF